MDDKNSIKEKESQFEGKLYKSLKRYGYLFPTKKEEVEEFENLYGSTKVDLPKELAFSKLAIEDIDFNKNLDSFQNIAAFAASEDVNKLFDLTDFEEKDEKPKN